MSDSPKLTLPPYVIERVMNKRGRLRVFDHFAPRETALVVIDMQRFYVEDVPQAVAIIPTINLLAAAIRARGGTVAWVQMTAGIGGKSLWPLYHEHFFTPEKGARHRDELTAGAPGHALHPDLAASPVDVYASKTRFSAFLPTACDLHEQLTARGIRNIAMTGMLTNFCCETSARDAMMLDYRVAMISDANAARYEEDHMAGFTTLYQSFGDILTADELLDDVMAAPAATASR